MSCPTCSSPCVSSGAVFFDIDARSPFVAQSPPTEVIAAKVAADADHLIAFHVITAGSCWVEAVDDPEPSVLLQAGEMVIFPAGEGNILASAPGMRGQPDLPALLPPGARDAAVRHRHQRRQLRRGVPDRVRLPRLRQPPVQPAAGVVAADGARPGVRAGAGAG